MVNEVVSGICERISEEFGDDYKIYTEQVPQEFKTPCFFVSVLSEEIKPIVGRRYIWKHSVNVVYSPSAESNEQREDVYDKLLTLIDVLEHITAGGDLIRGTDISGEVLFDEAGIYANVKATYEYTVYKQKSEKPENMQELNAKVGSY